MDFKIIQNKSYAINVNRAYHLSNGDIIEIKIKDVYYLLEYENNLLYEVKYEGLDEYIQSIYTRTGKVFTPKEINNMIAE